MFRFALSKRDIDIGDILVFKKGIKAYENIAGLEYKVIKFNTNNNDHCIDCVLVYVPENCFNKKNYQDSMMANSIMFPDITCLEIKTKAKPHEYSPVNMTGYYKTVGD